MTFFINKSDLWTLGIMNSFDEKFMDYIVFD